MKKILALMVLLTSGMLAQTNSVGGSQNSVYVTMWANQNGSQTFTAIPNIGATGHQVLLTTTGASCFGTVTFYGSTDRTFATSTVALATGYATSGTNINTQIIGTGLYPYLEVVFTVTSGTCTSSAWYTGSKAIIPPYTIQGQLNGLDAPNTLPTQVLALDNFGGLYTMPITGYNYDEFETIITNQTIWSGPSHHGLLGSVIIATAGTGSATVVIKCSGNTVLNIDATAVRVVPVGFALPASTTCTLSTTGTVAPKVTLIGLLQ